MKTSRLLTALSIATLTGTLMLPAPASAHDRHEGWRHHDRDRWSEHSHRHTKWHHRHGHRHGRAKIDVTNPRRAPRIILRDLPRRDHWGDGLTIIYRSF